MTNTCEECLVRVMCREPCDLFIDHLDTKKCRRKGILTNKYDCTLASHIAWGVKNKAIKLIDNDTKWRWTREKFST